MLCYVMMVFSNALRLTLNGVKGTRELAHKHSQSAKKWGIGGIASGIVLHLANIVLVGVTFAMVYILNANKRY